MNSDLTLVPFEKKAGGILSLMGFITPIESVPLLTGQANEKNQIAQNILTFCRMLECPKSRQPVYPERSRRDGGFKRKLI